MKDLGITDYDTAKAPFSGYKSTDITMLKGHMYAIKTESKNTYVIKITNVINESEIEFMARKAEIVSSDSDSVIQKQSGETKDNIIDLVATSIGGVIYSDKTTTSF